MLHPMFACHDRWCVYTMFDASMPGHVSSYINRCCFPYWHMLRPMHAVHDWCLLLLDELRRPWLMSPNRFAHTTFDACMPWQIDRRCFLYNHMLSRCVHVMTVVFLFWLMNADHELYLPADVQMPQLIHIGVVICNMMLADASRKWMMSSILCTHATIESFSP